jgi:hypothetical protein
MVFSYKDLIVTPKAIRHGDVFAATALVRELNGRERSVCLPGEFPCSEDAIRFAIESGYEYIDVAPRCRY